MDAFRRSSFWKRNSRALHFSSDDKTVSDNFSDCKLKRRIFLDPLFDCPNPGAGNKST